MSLHERITEDMKAAMRARDSARLSASRLLLAALKQKQVDERAPGKDAGALAEADVLGVIEKMLRQRRESIAQFEKAGRTDLAESEKFEVGVLSAYLPQQMDEAAMRAAIDAAVAETGATTVKDMGKVMAALRTRHAATLDMAKAGPLVKARLGG